MSADELAAAREVCDDRINLGVATSHQTENGDITTVSSVESERVAYAFIPQTPIRSTDAHLEEFSEAMRSCSNFGNDKLEQLTSQLALETASIDQTSCCGNHGICSHQILQDECPGPSQKTDEKIAGRKAPFRLLWGCDGDKNGQHKRDFVSFEKGDIKTAERSNKQILLKWESPPQTVLFVTKPNSNSVLALCAEMVRWLKEHNNMNVFVEPRVSKELLTEDSYFNFIQTWNNGKWLFVHIRYFYALILTFPFGFQLIRIILTDQEAKTLHTKVDLIVTLGGDGTVLWVCCLSYVTVYCPRDPFHTNLSAFLVIQALDTTRICNSARASAIQ
ncbi:putative NAD kinase 3 [Dichanthelium oligosanthes]|uniref:Putative NAD kinase 3 n=1 Tax=Dichanthelium oligosanthes TaxID=888268 RepID=A0A1E5VC89_9POAL|nr:putative NAD kinase 3 [Dichanthelium oligosanthes]